MTPEQLAALMEWVKEVAKGDEVEAEFRRDQLYESFGYVPGFLDGEPVLPYPPTPVEIWEVVGHPVKAWKFAVRVKGTEENYWLKPDGSVCEYSTRKTARKKARELNRGY